MRKFWNWARDADTGERVLTMRGPISDETWFGDEVTPGEFRAELESGSGPVTAIIDSPGGDVFAAAQIYNMLRDYKDDVTVRIDSLAASAASVIAMSGKTVEISPTGYAMIHNPSMMVRGDSVEMQRAKDMLDEVKEGIINAYEMKTGLPRDEISRMMDAETWLSARKAVEMGFADKIMFEDESKNAVSLSFSRSSITNSLLSKIRATPLKDVRIIVPTPARADSYANFKPADESVQSDTDATTTKDEKEAVPVKESDAKNSFSESDNDETSNAISDVPDKRVDAATLKHRLNLISH